MANNDPIKQLEAQTLLQNLQAKTGLDDFGKSIDQLFAVSAPQLKTITTPDELKGLISAIQSGKATNNQLTSFITIANKILGKL